MQNFDSKIETKFGLTTDTSLGKQVKITILASGFSLFGKERKRTAEIQPIFSPENEEEELKRQNERMRFYGTDNEPRRKRHRVYILSPEEMLSDGMLLSEIENTPTALRTATTLEHLRQTSEEEQRTSATEAD